MYQMTEPMNSLIDKLNKNKLFIPWTDVVLNYVWYVETLPPINVLEAVGTSSLHMT